MLLSKYAALLKGETCKLQLTVFTTFFQDRSQLFLQYLFGWLVNWEAPVCVSDCRMLRFCTFIWCSYFTCLLSDNLLCWMNHWCVLIGQFAYSQVFSEKRWVRVLNRIVVNVQQEMHVHLHAGMYLSYPGLAFFVCLFICFTSHGIGLDRCIFIAFVEAEMEWCHLPVSCAAGIADVSLAPFWIPKQWPWKLTGILVKLAWWSPYLALVASLKDGWGGWSVGLWESLWECKRK